MATVQKNIDLTISDTSRLKHWFSRLGGENWFDTIPEDNGAQLIAKFSNEGIINRIILQICIEDPNDIYWDGWGAKAGPPGAPLNEYIEISYTDQAEFSEELHETHFKFKSINDLMKFGKHTVSRSDVYTCITVTHEPEGGIKTGGVEIPHVVITIPIANAWQGVLGEGPAGTLNSGGVRFISCHIDHSSSRDDFEEEYIFTPPP